MKKKVWIGIVIFLMVFVVGMITNYVDSGRVTTGHEPKYCIKVNSKDSSKVTYWGLGYKVVRYVGVSPDEPYESNIGAKMGNWFMKYELPESDIVEIQYGEETVAITNRKDMELIQNILINSKYDNEICDGISTHKITLNNDVYYIKEHCKEIQKGNKQATISAEDLEIINQMIPSKKNNQQSEVEYSFYGKVVETTADSIIVEPNEEEEERKSADKILIGLGENTDEQYRMGTNVKVTYNGMIMESYPAQVEVIKIEVVENFENR